MKDFKLIVGILIGMAGLLSLVAMVYSVISALWEFNPTSIQGFNGKLFGTSLFALLICMLFAGLWSESEEQ